MEEERLAWGCFSNDRKDASRSRGWRIKINLGNLRVKTLAEY